MLYAQVIVKKKTRVEELTYSLLAPSIPFIRVGSLVTVPLRSGVVEAVVVGFRRTVPRELRSKIRPVASVVKDRPVYSEKQIRVIETLAAETGASLAEVAFHALREPAERSVVTELKVASRPVFLQAVLVDRLAAYRRLLEKLPAGRTALFIFAQNSVAQFFYHYLPTALQNKVVVDDGKVRQRQKWRALQKTGELRAVIGTIGTAFWPLRAGDTCVVDQPYHVGAVSGQRPYLTAYQIVAVRSRVENLQLVLGDVLVAIEDIPRLQTKAWRLRAVAPKRPDFLVANRQRSSELLLPSLKDRLTTAVNNNRRLLLLVLSRGWSSAMVCRDCGHILKHIHGQPLPSSCPECRGCRLGAVGEGVTQVCSDVAKEFPHVSIQEVSSDQPLFDPAKEITVATEKILSFPAATFDELLVVSADRLLAGVELDGTSQLVRDLIELSSRVKTVTIQTFFPDSFVWSAVSSGQLRPFYQRELTARRRLHLPPYGLIFELIGQGSTAILKESEQVVASVQAVFPEVVITSPELTHGASQSAKQQNHLSIRGHLPVVKVTASQKAHLRRLLPPAWFVRW